MHDEQGGENPSVRLFKYHPENYTVYDYDQYFANLTRANEQGGLTWELTYRASDMLGQHTFSGAEGEALMDRLRTDDAFFAEYYAVVHGTKAPMKACDAKCRAAYICEHAYVTLADRKAKCYQ